MHLELAEQSPDLYLQQNDEMIEGEEMSPYIFVPGEYEGEGVYVREDYFDDLPDDVWERTMEFLESNQPGMSLFGFGKKGRARRLERRERRHERRLEKKGQRFASKEARVTTRADGTPGFFGTDGGLQGILGTVFGGGAAPVNGAVPERKPMPWLGIGLGVAILGGVVYFATRKKKKR